jgi:hypothetical protein
MLREFEYEDKSVSKDVGEAVKMYYTAEFQHFL